MRLAALESGEVDFAYPAPPDAYDRLKANPDIKMLLMKDRTNVLSVLNKKQGLFTNVKLRQAFLAALDMEPILRAFVGHPAFYRLDASLAFKDSPWWTDVGREQYNQRDQVKARRLLQEAGYQGEPMRYMTTPEGDLLKLALATKQQLEEAGFTVELQMVEWATLTQRWHNPDLWDALTTGWTAFVDPTLYHPIRCEGVGWNCDPDFERLLHAMEIELQFEKRYRLWQDIQQLFWERVPVIHYGQLSALNAIRKHGNGPFDMLWWPYFWNVWLAK